MATKTVFYSVMDRSRMVAEGVASALDSPLFGLTDRFSTLPAGWKRVARRAVRGFDLGVLRTSGVSFERGDRLVLVTPYWDGPVVPAVSGFVRAVELTGVTVILVVTRRFGGGDDLIFQLEDDIVRQGGTIGGVFTLRMLWRGPRRLRSLGNRVGQHIARVVQGVPTSLQELLENAIEDEVEVRGRYSQLVEMTPNRRLKRAFTSLSADKAAHAQQLQQLYRAYTGVVYEPHREAIVSLKAGQVLDYNALLQGLDDVVEAEHKAFRGYWAIAERYPSQPDVVRLMLALSRSDLQHYRNMRRVYTVLSRHRSRR
jgi:rubrerythrin